MFSVYPVLIPPLVIVICQKLGYRTITNTVEHLSYVSAHYRILRQMHIIQSHNEMRNLKIELQIKSRAVIRDPQKEPINNRNVVMITLVTEFSAGHIICEH